MFRTEVHIPETSLNLHLHDRAVTIGSCFAEVIGTKLLENKANVLVNPFGTIFNPVSVGKLLKAVTGEGTSFEESLVQRDGIWYCYDLHSSLSSSNKEELLQLIAQKVEKTKAHLSTSKLLIVTLGTAVSYKLADTGTIVANCHKLPAKQFTRELLTVAEIVESVTDSFKRLKKFNPELQFILTVSPVRHVKETLPVNSVSKSILRVATHYLSEQLSDTLYFPAYEIMLDDLRDYRFYGSDMLHPTSTAEEYIWQKFTKAYLHPEFQSFIIAWEKMKRAIVHKPFHPQTDAHQAFIRKTIEQLQQLSITYKISTTEEEAILQSQLIT